MNENIIIGVNETIIIGLLFIVSFFYFFIKVNE